eukprot:2051401-Prymnesium_polylepis.2
MCIRDRRRHRAAWLAQVDRRPKVAQQRQALRIEQHVLRLEVAIGKAQAVHVLQHLRTTRAQHAAHASRAGAVGALRRRFAAALWGGALGRRFGAARPNAQRRARRGEARRGEGVRSGAGARGRGRPRRSAPPPPPSRRSPRAPLVGARAGARRAGLRRGRAGAAGTASRRPGRWPAARRCTGAAAG